MILTIVLFALIFALGAALGYVHFSAKTAITDLKGAVTQLQLDLTKKTTTVVADVAGDVKTAATDVIAKV
jgi:hypothetical protein